MSTRSLFCPRLGKCALLSLTAALVAGSMTPAEAAPPKREKVRISNGLEKVGNFFFRIARTLEQDGFSYRGEKYGEPDVEVIYERRATGPVREEESFEYVPPRSTGLVVPPGYREGMPLPPGVTVETYGRSNPRYVPRHQPQQQQPFTPPDFQENPQPNLPRGTRGAPPRSSLNMPVGPDKSAAESRMEPRQPAGEPRLERPIDPSEVAPSSNESQGARKEPREKAATAPGPAAQPKAGPGFATPVAGHPGFVYPPGVAQEPKNMIDVRGFAPGQKVRDPRSGEMFLVPPKQ